MIKPALTTLLVLLCLLPSPGQAATLTPSTSRASRWSIIATGSATCTRSPYSGSAGWSRITASLWSSYADLAEWRRLTGRDAHSSYADPRDPKTVLQGWAQSGRKAWDIRLRPRAEMNALNLGLVESPSGAEARSRIVRAASVTAFETGDPAIKAFLFDFNGQKTLALWTTRVSERRPLRLALGQASVTLENGYGRTEKRSLPQGVISLRAGYIPTYLRGVAVLTPAKTATSSLPLVAKELPAHAIY